MVFGIQNLSKRDMIDMKKNAGKSQIGNAKTNKIKNKNCIKFMIYPTYRENICNFINKNNNF